MTLGTPPPDAGVHPGQVLAGKYRVERLLGAGGMGVVVAAHHLQLDERVALKFLLPAALRNPEILARFDREARAAVKIKSEHVARVVDVGKLENGAPYLVMEYLEGDDLAGWLKQHGPMPVELAVDFVLQACEAIAEAHSLGIVHRDLKPANLFRIVRPDGLPSIKVLDFGISKMTGFGASGPDMGMTRTSAMLGSPYYMSPEQMQSSKSVDARADIWALGVILFELLTGHLPFDAEGMPQLALKVMTEPPPPLRGLRPDAPPGLELAVRHCLEKDRALRCSSVSDLAAHLMPFGSERARASVDSIHRVLKVAGIAPSGSARISAPATSTPSLPSTLSSWGQTGGARGSGPRAVSVVLAAGGLTAMAAMVIAAVVVARRPPKDLPRELSVSAIDASPTPLLTAALPPPPVATAHAPLPVEVQAGSRVADASAPAAASVLRRPPLSAAPAPAPARDCDVPYYFDAAGNRVFKKECL